VGDPWLSITLTLCHILHFVSHWPVLVYYFNCTLQVHCADTPLHCSCCCRNPCPLLLVQDVLVAYEAHAGREGMQLGRGADHRTIRIA
jgi:hypothetical protein